MVSEGLGARSVRYKIGWWLLVVIVGESVLNHISRPLLGYASGDDQVLAFWGLVAMNLYALVVLLTSYRHGERWARWVTWVLLATYALVILYAPDVGPWYLGATVVMAVAQLLSWADFRQPDQVALTG